MAVLMHISKAENKKSIFQSGIRVGKYSGIVYFMPHMQEFLISHQWARELKRWGVKKCIAVDFKIPVQEKVWFGKYSEGHKEMSLNKAIQLFMSLDDKWGYEFFIERKIEAKEITKIRNIPKPVGWRYEPFAHGKEPCPCPVCLQKGGFKTKGLREAFTESISRKDAKEILLSSDDDDALYEALERMKGKWRKESPKYLESLLRSKDEYVLYSLTGLLAKYRHPLALDYLRILASCGDEDTKKLSLEILEKYKNAD